MNTRCHALGYQIALNYRQIQYQSQNTVALTDHTLTCLNTTKMPHQIAGYDLITSQDHGAQKFLAGMAVFHRRGLRW